MDITTLLAGPLGGALGLVGALAQKWLGMKEAREAHAQKMAEMELMSRVDLQKADIMFRSTVEEKSGEAFKAAIDAQAQLRAPHRWAQTVLVLFRPGLTTYLIMASTAIALVFAKEMPELLQFIVTSMFSMSSVSMGYWFGVRTDEKFKVTPAVKR